MKKTLRILFMGTPEFAVASLASIHDSDHEVVAVVTVADKPAGRGKKLRASAVKRYAVEHNIPVLQPTNLKSEDFGTILDSYDADLYVVVAFRMLPEKVWSKPRLGTINLHGSLLPDYRGAAPIHWAVINGDTKTGVTTFFINEKIDTGEILLQEELTINLTDDTGIVHDKMMALGATTLLKTIDLISEDNINPTKQQWNEQYRKAPKIHKKDCLIDWEQDTVTLYNKIRGLSPFPVAYTHIVGDSKKSYSLKIYKTWMMENTHINSGEIAFPDKETMLIGTKDGSLSIQILQLEGKKRMNIADFMRGFNTKNAWKCL